MLGGPGSGKTWLARRQVRLCAEAASDALANSAIADVELPLYTTCAALRDASGEGIRHHVVTSALGLLPDLGGTRIMASLRELFNNRNGHTLLVADSLDEATGVDSRISNLGTLPPAWRIMLTTRPGAWTRQLAVNEADPLQRTGVLQPMRFPSDVERFVTAWFSGRPDQAAALNGQLRDRPALQPAAAVPLILAFFCVLGGEAPLPGRRSDLYAKVIRRMLTGSWRTSGNQNLDVAACEAILRKWAWSTVAADRVSGIGRWKDEFLTAHVKGKKIRDALTHIAVPLGGPPYPEPGTVRRRFVHRSIQEHLVAEHVRDHLPAKETAAELPKHIWFDVDWEHAAPAALARHPKHNRILKDILRRITGDSHSGAALAAVDGSWEIRRFLARVAQESSEDDWAPELAELIGQARVDLVSSGPSALKEIIAPEWPTSNQLVVPALVRLLLPIAIRRIPSRCRACSPSSR